MEPWRRLDAASPEVARELLLTCCQSSAWADAMERRRPFGSADALHHALSLDAAERAERAEKLRAVATARTPAGWLQKQLDAVAPSEQP